MPLLLSSTTTTASLFLKLTSPLSLLRFSTMSSINLQSHAFAGNPIKAKTPKSNDPFSPNSALEALKSHLLGNTHDVIALNFKVLPFRKGRPLAGSQGSSPNWHLGWLSLGDCKGLLADSSVRFEGDSLVYLGSKSEEDSVYWAIDVSEDDKLVDELGKKYFSFVELRTLMVATDWSDSRAMADLAVAGHARALLEWHGTSRFCGQCGSKTIPREAGKRVQCSNELCKKRIYPRVDPVVIMLVIDKENDRALLSRQSRFVPRMWSCLAGFFRVGPSSMPCQLMVGFFAYAKSLEITVDKDELEDAQWHSREDVKRALTFAEYEKAQKTAAAKVEQICKGVTQSQNLSSDFNTESGELASMFIPGPFAIAHHLISTWVFQGAPVSSSNSALKEPNSSLSNL
uniref:NADH pyrophosphatase-like N-terminal domain-containing protein n=1 Tax=Chenopodium quinoa TaxID=63459 RepID=A0A803MQC5_CHEQI